MTKTYKDIYNESLVKNEIQFWYSKWCNSCMKDEREIYWSLYKGYQDLYDYYKKYYRFTNE